MLSPEALEEAGEALARVYRGIEADMLDYLVDLMLSGAGITSKSVTAAALLGQTHADELRRIIESHAGEVDAELRATVEKFMRASDADDMERLGRPGTERAWPRQMDATVRGLAAILQRDNLHMEQGALDAFLSASTEAITRVNSGASTAERALHSAVRRLERDGVCVVQYRDAAGNLTVRNRVDVAVRRHVRTQIAQDGARMTARAMDEYGVQLVEVSSHPNARPSHAAWQGRVYGWRGAVSIDGRSYEGLEAATGYGSVDGLLGANCRHSFGPYLPGAPRAYERDPKHASGLPGDEVYRLEQRQRAGERAIREAKRELAGARKCYDASPTNESLVEVVRAQDLLTRRQEAMRRLVAESNARSLTGRPVLHRHPAREWAGDMPRVTLSVSARTKQRARETFKLMEACAKKRRPIYDNGALGHVARTAYGKMDKEKGYIVVCHGAPSFVDLLGQRSDHKVLADVIRARDDYEDGTPVQLMACSTGKAPKNGSPCFAQRLADELGAPVTAPDGTLQVYSNGRLEVGDSPGDNTGEFITFQPREGKK
jgi:hypothetical protein